MLVLLVLCLLLSPVRVQPLPPRQVGGVVALPPLMQIRSGSSRPPRAIVQGAWSLRSVYARSLAMAAAPTAWWTLAIAGFAGWMVIVDDQTASQLMTIMEGSPVIRDVLNLPV